MVTITFPDRETEKRALGFLLGRWSGRVLRGGIHLVPEAALEALADQNIPFTVKGKATYEQQLAALRGAAPRFLLCVKNDDYPASLEVRKVYQAIPDAAAAARHFVRVVDESGEDYLYPDSYFVPIEVPQSARDVFVQA